MALEIAGELNDSQKKNYWLPRFDIDQNFPSGCRFDTQACTLGHLNQLGVARAYH